MSLKRTRKKKNYRNINQSKSKKQTKCKRPNPAAVKS